MEISKIEMFWVLGRTVLLLNQSTSVKNKLFQVCSFPSLGLACKNAVQRSVVPTSVFRFCWYFNAYGMSKFILLHSSPWCQEQVVPGLFTSIFGISLQKCSAAECCFYFSVQVLLVLQCLWDL